MLSAFLLITFTGCTSQAGTLKHPSLVVTDKDKPLVLEKIRTMPWAKNTYETMLERITPYVERHKTNPEWILSRYLMNWTPGNHYTDFYASQGAYIDRMEGNAPNPTVRVAWYAIAPVNSEGQSYLVPSIEDLTPYDTSSYWNLINSATGQKEPVKPDGLVENINRQINQLALEAAIIYWLTDKEEYARFAADILDQFAKGAYYQNPIHGHRSFGFIASETHRDLAYMPLTVAYDFLHAYLVKNRYEMKYYQPVWDKFANTALINGYRECNWYAYESCVVMYPALMLEDESRRNFFVEHFFEKDTIDGGWGHSSLRTTVEEWLTPDGHWKETTSYHLSPIINLLKASLAMENNGYKVFENYPALFDAASVMMKYVYPNLYICSFGDASRFYPSSALLELALVFAYKYRQEALPELLACMDQLAEYGYYSRDRMDWFSLLCYLPEVKNEQGHTYHWARSGELEFARLYLQRNGMDKNYGMMYTIQCGYYNHNHSNGMSMELYGAGDIMGIDPGNGPNYHHELHRTYFSQWAAHNSVVAAGSSASSPYSAGTGNRRTGELEVKAMEPLANRDAVSQYVSFTDTRYFDRSTQTNQQRTMALVRTSGKSGYYVDIFRSDNKMRNDYMYHNIGNKVELFDANGRPLQMQSARIDTVGDDYPGFRYISNVKSTGLYAGDVVALFTLEKGELGSRCMKAFMPFNKNHNYYTGYSPKSRTAGSYTDLPVPTIMVQTKGEAWNAPFITVYEPYYTKDGASVQKVTQLNRDNGGEYTALLIDGKDGEQQYIFQGVKKTDLETAGANYKFNGYFGVVSLRNKEIQYVYLGQGKKLTFGDYTIEGQGEENNVNVAFSGKTLTVNANQPVTMTVGKIGITTVTLNSQPLQTTQSDRGIAFTVPAVKNGIIMLN